METDGAGRHTAGPVRVPNLIRMDLVNLSLLAIVNLAAASAALINALWIGLRSDRPAIRRIAGSAAMLASFYVLIFANRFAHGGIRDSRWIGELGTVAAPLAFALVWIWPLRTMHRYSKAERQALTESDDTLKDLRE